MSSRPPLSSSHRENAPLKTIGGEKDVEHKLKKALMGLAEERRKRAEVEGVVEGLKREKSSVSLSIETMQQKLDQAQAEIKAQKTTIMRLSSASAASSAASVTYSGLETKLQDLIEKHNQSKAKHAAEIADITSSNKTLQSLISSLQASSASDRQNITDLRSERALLKKEVETLRSRPPPVRDEKGDEMSEFKAERKVWREEKVELECQVREMKKRLEEVGVRGLDEKVSEMEERVKGMEGVLRDITQAYADLYANTVDKGEYENMRDELEVERTARRGYERKWRAGRHDAQILRMEHKELEEQFRDVAQERDSLLMDLGETLDQRALDRSIPISISQSDYTVPNPISPSSDILTLLDLTLNHLSLLISHTSYKSTISHETISSISSDLSHAVSSLSSTRSALSTIQATQTSTSNQLEEMLKNHMDCHDQILNWRGEANRAIAAQDRLKSELCDLRVELERIEERAKGDREALRRANEGSARWGAARVALEDEVESLRSALEASTDLQERYDALFEETEILRSREAMALDEADRLGLQNSELIGHGNGSQKISYVEGLRREMALVKHELATTRHHLNSALSQISTLTSEIDSYKSITPSLLSSTTGTGRVRVARRQPQGGEVLGASMARRSVSVSASASASGLGSSARL